MSALRDALRELAQARRSEEIVSNHIAQIQADIENTPQWLALAGFRRDLAEVKASAAAVTERAKELALDDFYVTENRRPAEGVQVKLFSKVDYQRDEAEKWCLGHACKYLILDARAFEKAAPVLRDLGAPVQLTRDPRVSIATDLSAWLTSEGDPDGN